MGLLDRVLRRRGPEESASDVVDELKNPFEKKKPEWRTTPEPEIVLDEAQQQAIDTAALRAHAFLDRMRENDKLREQAGKKISIYDARVHMGLVKGYTGFLAVLEHGKPLEQIAAAAKILEAEGEEALTKLERNQERLRNFQEKLTSDQLSSELLETLQGISKDIEADESDLRICREAILSLAQKST